MAVSGATAALRPAGDTHARQPRAAPPSRRICQRALYSCRQLPSVMFSNTTPRPLLCEQAGFGQYAKKTVLKDAQLQAGFPQRPFSLLSGCSQCGAAPRPTGRSLQEQTQSYSLLSVGSLERKICDVCTILMHRISVLQMRSVNWATIRWRIRPAVMINLSPCSRYIS